MKRLTNLDTYLGITEEIRSKIFGGVGAKSSGGCVTGNDSLKPFKRRGGNRKGTGGERSIAPNREKQHAHEGWLMEEGVWQIPEEAVHAI